MVAVTPPSRIVGLPSQEACNEFRQLLLIPTFKNALKTPFFKTHLNEFSETELNLETWSELPLVNKDHIRAAGQSAQNLDGIVCNEIFSGGTTGDPFITVKGDREQKYISRFYNEVFRDSYNGKLPRALQINNPYHGHLVSIPVPMHSHKIGIYDRGSFAHGRQVLYKEHKDYGIASRCTLLIGLERCLRAFTVEAIQSNYEKPKIHLQAVISYSQLLTSRWRKILQQTWDCPVIDRFGLSEVFGGATLDIECGWWHFDPVLLPEVIGVQSRAPIQEGIGELILTGLYPFQEAQPLIRYETGDLVEVTHTYSSRPGELAIRPLGRLRYGVPLLEGGAYLLTPSQIYEIVDANQNVLRAPRFLDAEQVKDPQLIGHPYYTINFKVKNKMIHIALAIVAKQGINHSILRDQLYNDLMASSNILYDAVERKEAKLVVSIVDSIRPDLISHAD